MATRRAAIRAALHDRAEPSAALSRSSAIPIIDLAWTSTQEVSRFGRLTGFAGWRQLRQGLRRSAVLGLALADRDLDRLRRGGDARRSRCPWR